MTTAHVYQAINQVQAELAKVGISKERTNTQGGGGGFKFRGIDDVLNALSPLMAEHKLVILPRVQSRETVERISKSGGALFYVTIRCEFDIVSSVDGSKHTVCTFGEAMDSGDKATNKAMSAAYKYMAIQSFSIPTEGDNDADATTHEVTPKFDVSAKRAIIVRAVADACIAKHAKGDEFGAYEEAAAITDGEERRLLWDHLKAHSAVRSAIKAMAAADKATA